MPRPQVIHDGFLIPNAGDVTNPRMAEPDRIDFNTLAHGLWGVIEGCEVTAAGGTASTLGGLLVVNGLLVTLNQGTVSLGVGGAQDRFDLVVSDTTGTLTKVVGTQSVDPVFPDPPVGVTVLAAVFCPAGSSDLANNVIDKRRFVAKKLLTKIPAGENLVRNVNGTGDYFHINGDGAMEWSGDTAMWRIDVATLRIRSYLTVDETITAHNLNVGNTISAGGLLSGSNLIPATTAPTNANTGAIFQDTVSGRVYVRRAGKWEELATLAGAVPVGAVISSIEPPAVMEPLGWVVFGTTINEEPRYAKLFTLQALQRYIVAGTPRTMVLPSAAGYVLCGGGPGWAHGQIGVLRAPNVDNMVTLTINNMPNHGHNPRTVADGGASPRATLTRSGDHSHAVTGGAHDHDINDPGHAHNGMDLAGHAAPVICKIFGATNKLDALFNDSNHTHSVEAVEWTVRATTKINILQAGSEHSHQVEKNGDHTHTATISDIPDHTHDVIETLRGGGVGFDITPKFLTTYFYIRS